MNRQNGKRLAGKSKYLTWLLHGGVQVHTQGVPAMALVTTNGASKPLDCTLYRDGEAPGIYSVGGGSIRTAWAAMAINSD